MQYLQEAAEFFNEPLANVLHTRSQIDIKKEIAAKGRERWHRETLHFIFTLLDWENGTKTSYTREIVRFAKEAKVETFLDYGCGIGYDALRVAQDVGCGIWLADLPSRHLDFAVWRLRRASFGNKLLGVIKLDENDLPPLPRVDMVNCIAVIEHVERPQAVLRNLCTCAKYIAMRADPDVACPEHVPDHMDFVRRLDGQDKALLTEYGLKRINATDPTIFAVEHNLEKGC